MDNTASNTPSPNAIQDLMKRFFQELAQYMEQTPDISVQKPILDHIKAGGVLLTYPIKGSEIKGAIEELKNALNEKHIPLIGIMGQQDAILIRPEDKEQTQKANRNVLIALGNYYQEVDADKLENAIHLAPFIKDKEILSLHDLSEYEIEVLKGRCGNISAGFMLGTQEEKNGKQMLSVHTKNVFIKDPIKTDFCKAFLEAQLSMHGPAGEARKMQIDIDKEIAGKVASLKGTNTPKFIAGLYDRTKYIELNGNGFAFHRYSRTDDWHITIKAETCSITDPDYEVKLQRAMDQISDKVIVEEPNILGQHLSGAKGVLESKRPVWTVQQNQSKRAEKAVAKTINEMVKRKLLNMNPPFQYKTVKEAFDIYTVEAGKIIDAVVRDEKAEGYDDKDIQNIKSIFENRGIDPKSYSAIPAMLNNKVTEAHMAKGEAEKKQEISANERI